MSAFNPHEPMPLDLLKYKAQIEKNKGLHVNFPYGIIYPAPPGDDNWKTFVIPSPLYIGLTMRGFFYAPEKSTKASEFRVKSNHKILGDVYAGAKVTEDTLYFDFSGAGFYTDSIKEDAKMDVPGYYSVAIRFKDGEYLSMHLLEKQINSILQRDMFESQWEMQMKGSVHFLLSLHLSDEIGGSNSSIPKENFGSSYNIPFPTLGVGSYCILDCLVTDPSKQAILYIQQSADKTGAVNYNLTQVAQERIITFYIRSSGKSWFVVSSFDATPKRIDRNASKEYTNRIHTSVSDNLQIVRKYSEQGAERYD